MSQPTEIHTLAGAYALDALTEIERAAFSRHIAECAACDLEVAELRETASRIGGVAWELPPPRLRDAVMAEVARTRQVGRRAGPEPRSDVAVLRWRRWTAAAVAAGVVALGGIATVWAVQEDRVGDARTQADRLRSEQLRMGAVLGAADVRVRTAAAEGGGTVTVVVSPSLDDGFVMMNGLAAPPPGRAYQLWLITGTSPTSAGILAGGAAEGTRLLDSVGGADTLGVTLEPEGGSQQPTTRVLAGVSLV
jgi:anti-sigma factor RsiW